MTASIAVRPLTEDDADLLSSFRCSSGSKHEDEVESFINECLFEWTFSPQAKADDPRTLLLVDEGPPESVVAVAAHERLTALADDGTPLDGTKLELVAVALDRRGTRVAGQRIGDLAFAAVMLDLETRPARGPYVAGVVADDNTASIAMCDRLNLSMRVPSPHTGYHWRIGHRQ